MVCSFLLLFLFLFFCLKCCLVCLPLNFLSFHFPGPIPSPPTWCIYFLFVTNLSYLDWLTCMSLSLFSPSSSTGFHHHHPPPLPITIPFGTCFRRVSTERMPALWHLINQPWYLFCLSVSNLCHVPFTSRDDGTKSLKKASWPIPVNVLIDGNISSQKNKSLFRDCITNEF